MKHKAFLFGVVLSFLVTGQASAQFPPACPGTHDYIDSTYGGRVRQIVNPDGEEHNIYYHRSVWNADNSRMIGVRDALDGSPWRVTLFDGNGCFLKELYSIDQYSWQLVWDKHDPDVFYTYRAKGLYRYNVATDQVDLIKDYAETTNAIAVAPTLNQDGSRLMVVTSPNKTFRSYALADMTDERAFTIADLPANCDMRNTRYTGFQDVIAADCRNNTSLGTWFYHDTGLFIRQDPRETGHTDFSPSGKWAHFTLQSNQTVTIYTEDILTGENQTELYTAKGPFSNLHITWPKAVYDWFIVSFFPSLQAPPVPYTAPYDEVLQLFADGTLNKLTRTLTAYQPGTSFWSQPQASASQDGSRIGFQSDCDNSTGVDCQDTLSTDMYVLFNEPAPVDPVAMVNGPYAGKVTKPVTFTSIGSNDPDGAIVGYAWDFGDGTSSAAPNPVHSFSKAGVYFVTLTATDDAGRTGSATTTATITTGR